MSLSRTSVSEDYDTGRGSRQRHMVGMKNVSKSNYFNDIIATMMNEWIVFISRIPCSIKFTIGCDVYYEDKNKIMKHIASSSRQHVVEVRNITSDNWQTCGSDCTPTPLSHACLWWTCFYLRNPLWTAALYFPRVYERLFFSSIWIKSWSKATPTYLVWEKNADIPKPPSSGNIWKSRSIMLFQCGSSFMSISPTFL